MTTRGVGFLMPQPPTLDAVPPKANLSESPGNSTTSSGLKSGFRKSFVLQALYAYRSNKDPTGKELIRAIEKHKNELLHNIPHEGNILHELVRRGHTRKGLVDIILPKYPVAARAFEWKPDGTKMSLLRHAVEKKDRAVIEAIISATEHLLTESDKCTNFGEREDLYLELLDLEDWFEVLTEYPSLIDLHSVKAIFSLQPSAAEVVSDEPGWRAHIGPAELKIQGSDVPFPVNFWPVAVSQKLPSLLSRQTIRMMATPRTNNQTLSGTANLSNSHHHLLGVSARSGVNGDYYNTYSIDQSRYHHILPEATGVEVEPSLIGFPDAMRPGPRSLLQLCVDLCERTGRTSTFELEIVSAILQYKWNAFGRPIYKFCLIVSTLLAINYSLSSAFIDPLIFSDDRSVRVLAYVWQAAIWLNGIPLLCQEGLQLTSQGVVQYFTEAWNMLDVLSLLLVYATTIWRFFLPAGNTPYLLLSAFAALLLWAKLLAYLRGFHETGALVRMIFQIMIDMRYFLVVLAISIAGFGNCLYLIFRSDIEREGATNITPIKHSYGSLFHTYLVLFFALNSNLDYEPIDVSSHKLLAALVYVMYCMTTTILLLNLLIAIMSDSYDKVQEHAAAQGRYEQALAIIEIESMLPGIILDDERFFPRWVQVLRARRTGEASAADADQWSGRIRQISKKIDASEAKLAVQMESLDARLCALLHTALHSSGLGLANATARRTMTPDPFTHNMGLGEPQEGSAGAATAMLGLENQSPRPLRLPEEASLLAPAEERKGDGYRTPPTSRLGPGTATGSPPQGSKEGPTAGATGASPTSSTSPLALPSSGLGGGGVGHVSPGAGVRALEAKVASLESKIDLILAKLTAT